MAFWLFIGMAVAIVVGVFALINWLEDDYDEYDPERWD